VLTDIEAALAGGALEEPRPRAGASVQVHTKAVNMPLVNP